MIHGEELRQRIYSNMIDIAIKFMEGKVKTIIFPKLNAKMNIKGEKLYIKDRKNDVLITTDSYVKIASELYTYFCDITCIDVMTEIAEGTIHAKYCEDWLWEVNDNLFEKIKEYL